MATLEHTRTGQGRPALVFVHGFGCARSDWDEQVRYFSPRHETIALDLGGHGTSPGGPEHVRIETHGADVAALLQSLDLKGAVLIGHSMGCRVIADAASRVPDRVAALILVDGSRLGAAGSTAHLETLKAIETTGYVGFVEPLFAQMFSAGYDPAKSRPIIERAQARPPAIAGPLFADIGRYDSERFDDIYGRVRVPMLILQTTWTTPERKRVPMSVGQSTPYIDMVRKLVPQAEVEIIPDIGHFPQLERPAETNAILDRFLAKLR